MDSIPIQYDPDQIRRSLAITPTIAAPPSQPPPPGLGITLPASPAMPNVPQSASPTITAPRGTVAGDEAERTRLLSTGPGESQIYGKVTGSQFGQKHPLLGKVLGGVGQGLATLGDIGLSAVAPSLAINLPGTAYHHQALINHLNRQIGDESEEQEREAQTANFNADIPLKEAQTAEAEAKADQPDKDEWSVDNTYQGPNGEPVEVNKRTGELRVGGQSLAGIKRAPVASTETAEDRTVEKVGPDGKTHIFGYNPDTRDYDRDQGLAGAKPAAVRVESPGAADAALDRESGRFGKTYEGMNTAASGQLDKIDEAKALINGSASAQALGIPKTLTALVSGQGSGVRITQAELNMIAHARGIQGDFEGYINRLSGKGTLTAEQQRQIGQVLDDAKQRILLKQQIANDTLNAINSATTREQIVQADQQARKQFAQLEKYGRYEGEVLNYSGNQVRVVKISEDGKKVDLAPAE